MPYITKEKFNIGDLSRDASPEYVVVIAEPEYFLAKLYEKYLSERGFGVRHFRSGYELHDFLTLDAPDAVLLNPGTYSTTSQVGESIKKIARLLPRVRIITISYDTTPEDLKYFISAGITSHINRKLGRPRDVAEVVRAVLHGNN